MRKMSWILPAAVIVVGMFVSGCGGGGGGGGAPPVTPPPPPVNQKPVFNGSIGVSPSPANSGQQVQVSWSASDPDNLPNQLKATLIFNGAMVSSNATSPETITPPTNSGVSDQSFSGKVILDDGQDTTEQNFTVTVRGTGSPALVTFSLISTPVDTRTFNETAIVNGTGFLSYAPSQFKFQIGSDEVGFSLVISDVGGIITLPKRDLPVIENVTMRVHELGNPAVTVTTAPGSKALQYRDILGPSYVGFSGEDGSQVRNGSMVGFWVDGNGAISGVAEIASGNGHTWRTRFVRANNDTHIFAGANIPATFRAALFKPNLAFVGTPASVEIPTNDTRVRSIGMNRNGNPVLLTEMLGGTATVWEVAADMSGAMSPIVLDVAGKVLVTGSTIAGTVMVDYSKNTGSGRGDFMLIAVSSPEQALYEVSLRDQTYERYDLNGFITEAIDVIMYPTRGHHVVGLVGQQPGLGIQLKTCELYPIGPTISSPINVDGNLAAVSKAFMYVDTLNRHLLAVVTNGTNFVDIHNMDAAGSPILYGVPLPNGAFPILAERASGHDGFVVGYQSGTGSGAMLIRWDGTSVDIPTAGSTFCSTISVGKQVIVAEGRNPHQAQVYHGPTGTQSNTNLLGLNNTVVGAPGAVNE